MNESVQEAIGDDIKALGGPKPAAGIFYPELSPEQGSAVLRSWANPNRKVEPSPEQLFLMVEKAREKVGYSEVARHIEQRLNCRIEFLTPEDEQAKLQREYIAAVNRLKSLTDRIDLNSTRARAAS